VAASGWPADADLAASLGLAAGDDAARVSDANAAAIDDAKRYRPDLDPAGGPSGVTNNTQWMAILELGQDWYQNRNSPDALDTFGPGAYSFRRKQAIGKLLEGQIAVA
jgi:hypothetical protein